MVAARRSALARRCDDLALHDGGSGERSELIVGQRGPMSFWGRRGRANQYSSVSYRGASRPGDESVQIRRRSNDLDQRGRYGARSAGINC